MVRFFLWDVTLCLGEPSKARLDDLTSVNQVSIEFIFSSDLSGRGITNGTPWLEWQSEAMLDEREDRATRGFGFVIRGYRTLEGLRSISLTLGGDGCLLPVECLIS